MPGDKYRSIQNPRQYRALRRAGYDKTSAARISNAQTPGHRVKDSPADFLVVEDRTKPSTWHLQVKRNGTADHGLMGAAWAALHSGFRGNVYSGPGKTEALRTLRALYASEGMPIPGEKAMRPGRKRLYQATYADAKASGATPIEARQRAKQALRRHTAERAQRHADRAHLAIYKDTRGRDRWLSVSSTAYRDRDGEIVSRKALAGAIAKADASGQRGPLRFWHVPGLDLGDCDFQATAHDGRFLIESGTFRSKAIAERMRKAGPLQVSIGFLHAATQPDARGVFDDIAIFERSVVPAGYAANAMTSLTTKERTMDDRKRAAFVDLFGQELFDQLLTQTAATDKAAQDAGATYKEVSAPPPDWAQAILNRLDALEATKAAGDMPSPDVAVVAAGDIPPGEDEPADQEEVDVVDMSAADLRQLISDVIAEHMGTMGSTLAEIDGKMAAMGYQRAERKEADDEQIQAFTSASIAQSKEVAQLKARLAELEGLQPRAAKLGVAVDAATAKAITAQADPTSGDPLAQFLSGFNMNGK